MKTLQKIAAILLISLMLIPIVFGTTISKLNTFVSDTSDSDMIWLSLMNFTSVSVGPSENATNTFQSVTYDPWVNYHAVNVWAIADEEFRSRTYETTWFQQVSWDAYIPNRIEAGDNRLYDVFGIDLIIASIGTWESNNALQGQELLEDAISKTGFVSKKTMINYYTPIDILIVFTGQNLGYVAGADRQKSAIITTYQAYWADDNVIRHEVSHLFSAKDHLDSNDPHYYDDCIMSYRMVYIEFWVEDGWVWWVANNVSLAGISDNWCSECSTTIYNHRGRYDFVYHNAPAIPLRREKM